MPADDSGSTGVTLAGWTAVGGEAQTLFGAAAVSFAAHALLLLLWRYVALRSVPWLSWRSDLTASQHTHIENAVMSLPVAMIAPYFAAVALLNTPITLVAPPSTEALLPMESH